MQCCCMVFCRSIHIHDFLFPFSVSLSVSLLRSSWLVLGKRSVTSFFRKVCPKSVLLSFWNSASFGPIMPAYSSCLNSLCCHLLCKMRINRGTILLGPENVRWYQNSGSGTRPKCPHTNISQNIGVCLSPVCISFIYKEMLMKTIGPFQPQGWQSEPR